MDGVELRAHRGLLGLDANGFAAWLGVDRRTVRRWEIGAYPLPLQQSERILAAVASMVEHSDIAYRYWLERSRSCEGASLVLGVGDLAEASGLAPETRLAALALAVARLRAAGVSAHLSCRPATEADPATLAAATAPAAAGA